MVIIVHAHGYQNKGTHVSVFAKMKEGKHDEKLKWPFVGFIIITLLNQLENENHYSLVMSITPEKNMREGISRGFHEFIPHSALQHDPVKNTEYFKDDSLHFRVQVKVENHKPWLAN